MNDQDGKSAAPPSPFTPIADHAFLSNCHTRALVAPDGAINWLCVPRFDSPSVFGTLFPSIGAGRTAWRRVAGLGRVLAPTLAG